LPLFVDRNRGNENATACESKAKLATLHRIGTPWAIWFWGPGGFWGNGSL